MNAEPAAQVSGVPFDVPHLRSSAAVEVAECNESIADIRFILRLHT
jgi:hypothetical protein